MRYELDSGLIIVVQRKIKKKNRDCVFEKEIFNKKKIFQVGRSTVFACVCGCVCVGRVFFEQGKENMSFWSKFDKILTKVEDKGFRAANRVHEYTVNALILGFMYGTYTLFRDYNDFFIDARVR